jgi:hypothetical protein
VTIDAGTKTGSASNGTISLGATNASALTLGRTGVTTTNAGALTVTQLLTGNLGLTIAGAIANINASSNFATNINTGSSSGAVTIGNSSYAGAQTINIGSTNSTGGSSLTLNLGTSNSSTVTLGSQNGGSQTTIDAGNGGIAIGTSLVGGNIGIGGASQTGQIDIGAGSGAQAINLATGAAAKTVTIGSANSTSSLTLQSGSSGIALTSTSGNITIGTSDTTGTLLVLDTKTSGGDPSPVAGGMYYNSSLSKFRCYEGGAWKDCIASGGTVTLQNAYDNSSSPATITTTSSTKGVIIQAGTGYDQAALFQVKRDGGTEVLTVDSSNGKLTLRSNDSAPTYSSEMANNSFNTTNWTGSGWGLTGSTLAYAQHTNGGGTTALQPNPALSISASQTYRVTFTMDNYSTGSVTVSIGGTSATAATVGWRTYDFILLASGSGNLTFTPTNDFDGRITNVSVKGLTHLIGDTLSVQDSSGAIVLNVTTNTLSGGTFVGGGGVLAVGGGNSTAFGDAALSQLTDAWDNTAFGFWSQMGTTSGAGNTSVGATTLFNNTIGSYNTAIGASSLYANTYGSYNTALGYHALQDNTYGRDNTAVGYGALENVTTGVENVGVGSNALGTLTTGSWNAAFGNGAAQYLTGSYNAAFGRGALGGGYSGNSAFGDTALGGLTNSSYGNVGVGADAGADLRNASNSTFIGTGAGSTSGWLEISRKLMVVDIVCPGSALRFITGGAISSA